MVLANARSASRTWAWRSAFVSAASSGMASASPSAVIIAVFFSFILLVIRECSSVEPGAILGPFRTSHSGFSEQRQLPVVAHDPREVEAQQGQHRLRHRPHLLLDVVLVVDGALALAYGLWSVRGHNVGDAATLRAIQPSLGGGAEVS